MDITLYIEQRHLDAIRYFLLTFDKSKVTACNAKAYLYGVRYCMQVTVSYDEYVLLNDEGIIVSSNVL